MTLLSVTCDCVFLIMLFYLIYKDLVNFASGLLSNQQLFRWFENGLFDLRYINLFGIIYLFYSVILINKTIKRYTRVWFERTVDIGCLFWG